MTTVPTKQLEVRVANLDGEHDATTIERGLRQERGLVALKVYPTSAKVILTFDPLQTSPDTLKGRLQTLGFPVQKGGQLAKQPALWRNARVLTSAASGLLLLVGWLLERAGVPGFLPLSLYLVAMVTGGYFFGREAIEELLFERTIGIELLMSTAAVAASVMGQAAEGAILVFLYSISEAAEGYTEEKTRSAIKALMDLAPKTALVRRGESEVEIPVEELVVGDLFLVRPGQAIATDGLVLAGTSSVNQAPVTGESVPVEKQPDSQVFAGSINGEGVLEVRATKTMADNSIARIIHMVEEAQEKKGNSQRFIERFGSRYSPAVLALGVLIAVVPPVLFHAAWLEWLTRATVFIVAAAPCALVISIPITLVATLGTGARQGVLIKGGVYVEELARITVVAVDKTGTLTHGKPAVTEVLLAHHDATLSGPTSTGELLAMALGIEQHSEHPLARAILRAAQEQGIAPVDVTEVRALPGSGVSAQMNGITVYIGSPDLFHTRLGVPLESLWEDIVHLQDEGKTVVVVGTEQAAWGVIAIRDTIRANARKAIEALHAAGIQQVVMLTGDNTRTARAIASELGIDDVYAELKPEEKAIKVRELAERLGHVAMVGDGVNDAPALAEATVGIAMGAAGTDVALETADVALMADDLEKLAYALRLAQRNRTVVRQNLALSAIVVGALVVGAVTGFFSLPIAVLGHEISEFVVIGSGLRMLRS